ncbi:hypothetical protein [Pseudalkalibacillus caeni]|uniref:Uncharacterized protein n=1 Tax=Exobacillus caeni TaxID=2574798 RepID=A0A5R9F8R2_9BACL|nr:hypothetical protein [Pseudalkalibacillus caeni]TLS38640.1 hypothetical protein FCL54_03830 [Pseudalkalibacillus caeni]
MEETLNQILGELQKLNTQFDSLEKGQQELKTDVTDLKIDITGLKTDVTDLKTDVTGLKTDVTDLKTDVTDLKTDVTDLKTDVTGLKTDVTDLKTDVTDLKSGQDQLKHNLINGLGPYFEQIEKHIDTKTDELKDTLEGQQRVIDTLAARSIKHESDIKDFRRIMKNQ